MQLYQSHQDKLSLRGFCDLTSFPRGCLRYQLESREQQQTRSKQLEQEQERLIIGMMFSLVQEHHRH